MVRHHKKLLFLGLICFAFLLFRLWPKPALQTFVPQSTAIHAADGSLLRLSLAHDAQFQLWTPLKGINPNTIEAVKLYEDRYYHLHFGVNPVSLMRVIWRSFTGNSRQGASTISMQLARALYGINSRSIGGKVKQIAAAIWLELRYSKHEIIEAYLNIAPYGGNIKGIGTASLVYFNKPASQLNLPESLSLAVIPQNPNKRFALSNQNAPLSKARQRLWADWLEKNPSDAQYKTDIDLPNFALNAQKNLPFVAPHFTDALLSDGMPAGRINTGLQRHAQSTLERMLKNYITRNQHLGIKNASALLLDASSMQVKALVGSADYFNAEIFGQVNGTSAKRSPGSTLKPFIYALAMDQSLIHPASILKDTPTSFGPYTPENFDGRFIGPITAQDALIRSRNLPAVSLATKLSQPSLYSFLKNAGVAQLKSEAHYGLALVLGGGELTMQELVALYAMLPNRGLYQPFSYLKSDAKAYRLLSEEAAFITLDMLQKNPRPDTNAPDKHKVAWKTGTSWGFHDAWTIGVSGNDVLAVWVGNFDNTPNPAFVGIKTAAPLFFEILDSLRHQGLLTKYTAIDALPPRNISKVNVCTASGDLPNQYCKNLTETWFIPGKSPIKISNLHRPVYIDNTTNQAVCAPSANTRQEIIEFWDADMLRLFREAGMPRRVPPTLPPECSLMRVQTNFEAPQITSPLKGISYAIRLSDLRVNKSESIALRANHTRAGSIYWFAGDSFIAKSERGESVAWSPQQAGRIIVRAVDEAGLADKREVNVEFLP